MSDTKRKLGALLERTNERYARSEFRQHDPIEIVWEYPEKDRELIGFITASMAYGRVNLLKKAVRSVLAHLGPSPLESLLAQKPEEFAAKLQNFRYRMTSGEDVTDLLCGLRHLYGEFGSIEALYLHDSTPIRTSEDHVSRLGHVIRYIRNNRYYPELSRGFKYLTTDPSEGSSAKRMHLFARWMVRGPDEIDLGLWSKTPLNTLVMPLDTHTSQVCRHLGMTSRKSNDLKTALEVTSFLRDLDPEDPLRFDFPLCHLGISRDCLHHHSEEHCPKCPLQSACVIGKETVTY